MKNWISIVSVAMVSLTTSGCQRQQCWQCEPWQNDVVDEEYIHTYGVQVQPHDWMNRGQNGQVVSTLRNGVIVKKTFRDGYLEGDTTYSFPHSGATQRVESYSQGCLVSDKEHYASGAPCKEKEHHSNSSYTTRSWYENGAPKSRETYDDGKLLEADYYTMNNQVESRINDGSGNRIIRDDFGTLVQIDKFNNGELILSTGYYPNGAPREEIPYRNGKIDGPRKFFSPGGDPQTVEGWVENRKEGVTIVYQNGEKIADVPYFNSQKNGVEQRYRDGSHLIEEINWRHDKKHGPSYTYHSADNIRVDWYYNGKLVTKSQYDRFLNPQL